MQNHALMTLLIIFTNRLKNNIRLVNKGFDAIGAF